MPQKSPWTLSIPDCSLPTFIFNSATHEFPNGNAPCFLSAYDPDTKYLTRNTFRLWSQRFALGLQSMLGVQHQDRIMLFSANSMATPIAFMGTLMAGGIYTAANPAFTARELAFQWANSEAKCLFVEAAAIDIALAAARLNGFSKSRIFWFDDDVLFDEQRYKNKGARKGIRYWGGIFADADRARSFQWQDLQGENEARDTVLALNYSSGTTGAPKGVMITHKNYVANTIQQSHLQTLYPDYEERRKKTKWLCYLPLYHAMAQTIFLAGGPYLDAPVYIMSKFDFLEVLRYIEKYRITYFAMVPPIAVAVAKHPATKQFDLSSINAIGCGAAPLGSEASREVEKVWGGRLNLKQGWGMTEVTCSLLGWDPNKYSESYGVGEPNANCEAMVVQVTEDEKGNETFKEVTQRGPEHRGELWCRGPNIMKGYWKNPEATKRTFSPDGQWLRSGDIAYVDEEGCFFIVDRMKELIKVKGNQVAPAELEALILDHPGVADVAVIGVPTPDGDEKPKAYCVRQQGASGEAVKEQDIIDFVKDKVIRYKRLSACEFVEAIPKNPSGKILRRQLRDMAKKQDKTAVQAKL